MRFLIFLGLAAACVSGCVSTHADHFYVLQPEPAASTVLSSHSSTLTSLKVAVPSLVDRNELVLRDGNSVTVLEHERWASPLADQLSTVLGQDLEQRRPDILISTRRAAQSGEPHLVISVDIVDLTTASQGAVSLEARWHVQSGMGAGTRTGRAVIKYPLEGEGYGAMARSVSACVAQLADRLVQEIPAPDSP